MRNRHDGWADGRDDLPSRIRERLRSRPPTRDRSSEPPPAPEESAPVVSPGAQLVADLTRLALLFAAITVINMIFLLVALSFLAGRPAAPFLLPQH